MGSRWAMLEGMEEDKDRESFAHGGCEPGLCYLDKYWIRHWLKNLRSYNIYVLYANVYEHFDQYEPINWSMRKYLGWLDLKIKNIWITNKSIDYANLDHTIFDKYRACGWDLPWEQQININSFKY